VTRRAGRLSRASGVKAATEEAEEDLGHRCRPGSSVDALHDVRSSREFGCRPVRILGQGFFAARGSRLGSPGVHAIPRKPAARPSGRITLAAEAPWPG